MYYIWLEIAYQKPYYEGMEDRQTCTDHGKILRNLLTERCGPKAISEVAKSRLVEEVEMRAECSDDANGSQYLRLPAYIVLTLDAP